MEPRTPTSPFTIAAVIGLVLLAFVPRFVSLDSRPLMHDESMFAFYAFDYMRTGHYTHMPIMHGPVLMLAVGRLFAIFGDSILVARAFIAAASLFAMGACLAMLPRRFRWWFAPVLLLSPSILYYSRFLRDELLFGAFASLGILCCSRAFGRDRYAPFWGCMGMVFLLGLTCIMENAVFVYATGLTFLMCWWLRAMFWRRPAWSIRPRPRVLKPQRRTRAQGGSKAAKAEHRLLKQGSYFDRSFDKLTDKKDAPDSASDPAAADRPAAPPAPRPHPHLIHPLWRVVGWGAGIVLGVLCIAWVYGTTSPVGTFDPWKNIVDSWNYWEGQHKEHRIKGAFHYHIPILLTYELPVILMLIIGIARDALQRRRRAWSYAIPLAVWIVVWNIWRWLEARGVDLGPLQTALDFLHIDANRSIMVYGLIILPMLTWSLFALKEHRILAAFCGYWTATALFQYSVAGEKVPWLAIHIALPMHLMVCWVWAAWIPQMRPHGRIAVAAVVALACLISLRNDARLIFKHSADPAERIVYNHTSPAVHSYMLAKIHAWEQAAENIPPAQRNVFLEGNGWPGFWYFRKSRCFQMMPTAEEMEHADLIFADKGPGDALIDRLDKDAWSFGEHQLRIAWLHPWPLDQNLAPYLVDEEAHIPWGVWTEYFAQPGVWKAWWRYYWLRETWTPVGGFPVVSVEPLRMRR